MAFGAGGGVDGFVVTTGAAGTLVGGFGAGRTGKPAGVGEVALTGTPTLIPVPGSASILKSAGSVKSVPSGLARIILVSL